MIGINCFVKKVCSLFAALMLIIPVSAGAEPAYLFDEAGLFTDKEAAILDQLLRDTSADTGMNVAVLTTNDVGWDKSDSGVVDYADVFYEEHYGMDTDGILLLINNDTNYDVISTSGHAIRIFTDERVEAVFDYFWDYVLDGRYSKVVEGFCEAVAYYAGLGVPQGQYNYDRETGSVDYYEETDRLTTYLTIGLVSSAVFSGVVIFSVSGRYKLKPTRHAANYLDTKSVRLTQSTDTFIRRYVHKQKIVSDTNHGGGGGSSTHRSSGGGTHGGGGRHR